MMKYLSYTLLASLFVMFSCSKDNDIFESTNFSVNDYPQTWKLMKMTGSVEGQEWIGQDMEWQENYIFKSDSTFVKTRITDGESESASGFYLFESSSQNFLLDYEQSNPIIGTCGSDAKEYLYFPQKSEILLSNWWACDGPGLFYERIE